MISVNLRSVLLFHFGVAAIFVLIGLLSAYSLDLVHPSRGKEREALGKEARVLIEEEREIEPVRARALYYFDTLRGMRQARVQDTEHLYNDVRLLSFVVAGLFVLGGVLTLLLPSLPPSAPKPARPPG